MRKSSPRNHSANAARAGIAKVCSNLKVMAKNSNDEPIQLVQNVTAGTPRGIAPCLPSRDALRQIVKRVRREDLPPEPDNLNNFVVPAQFTTTINGDNFYKDFQMGEERILLFVTDANIINLRNASVWIMDGTFKTVPTIFKQLYTIHAPINNRNDSKIVPLLYALMSSKSEELYRRLFKELNELANQLNFILQPDFVLTDFGKGAMNAVAHEFPGTQNKCCHFHLAQSTYRRVQAAGLSDDYGSNRNLSLMIRNLPALAFLNFREIPQAFEELKNIMPAEAQPIVEWFEENYVLGRIRNRARNGQIRRSPPLFPPDVWSVYENIELRFPRTQNNVEAWYRRWSTLVGRAHIGLFRIIEEIRKEQNATEIEIERINRGAPDVKKRRDLREAT